MSEYVDGIGIRVHFRSRDEAIDCAQRICEDWGARLTEFDTSDGMAAVRLKIDPCYMSAVAGYLDGKAICIEYESLQYLLFEPDAASTLEDIHTEATKQVEAIAKKLKGEDYSYDGNRSDWS